MDSVRHKHKDIVAPRALSNDEAGNLRSLLKTTFLIDDNATNQRASINTRMQDEEDATVLIDYAMHMVEDGKSVGHMSEELVLLELPIFDATMVEDFEECLSTFFNDLPVGKTKSAATAPGAVAINNLDERINKKLQMDQAQNRNSNHEQQSAPTKGTAPPKESYEGKSAAPDEPKKKVPINNESYADRVDRKVREGAYASSPLSTAPPTAVAARAQRSIEIIDDESGPVHHTSVVVGAVSVKGGGGGGGSIEKSSLKSNMGRVEQIGGNEQPLFAPEVEEEVKHKSMGRIEQIGGNEQPVFTPEFAVDKDEKLKSLLKQKLNNNNNAGSGTEERKDPTALANDTNEVTPRHTLDDEQGEMSEVKHLQLDGNLDDGPNFTMEDHLALSTPKPNEKEDDAPLFYPVEARLVVEDEEDESYEDREPAPVYSAVRVFPWYKRPKIVGGVFLSAGVVIAASVGAVMGLRNDDTGTKSKGPMPEVFPPPPFNCTVSNLERFYDTDGYFVHVMGADGGTVAITRDDPVELPPARLLSIISSLGTNNSVIDVANNSLSGELASIEYEFFAGAIAVSGDTVFASDPYDPYDYDGNCIGIGAIYLFEKDIASGSWNQTVQKIVPDDIDEFADFGTSISIDGDTMAVTAPNDREEYGSAFIYQKGDDGWVQNMKLAPEDPAIKNFGTSSSVREGLIAISDSSYSDGKGAVFLYERESPSETHQWHLMDVVTNADCDGRFGISVAITDSNDLVIGCPDENGKGAVYYYKLSSKEGKYTMHQKINPQLDGLVVDEFGYKVVVNRNFMAIGTYEEFNGKTFIYTLHEGIWKRVATIHSPLSDHIYFGSDIAMSGENIFVSYSDNVYTYKLKCDEPEVSEESKLL